MTDDGPTTDVLWANAGASDRPAAKPAAPKVAAPKRAIVSIWVGQFASIEEAEAYFGGAGPEVTVIERCQFADDFGLDHFDPWCLEFHFERLSPRPLAQLLATSTFAAAFTDQALAAAARADIGEAQGIALVYHIDYQANSVFRPQAGPLRFLGTFPFTGELVFGEQDTPCFQIAVRLRYPARAVFLVLEAFQSLAAERSGHVTPRDLCTALRKAVDEQSLRECKLLTGEDVGRIVLAAVESRLLNVREGESETDYAGLYALDRE